ncbi:MAG: WD40/YVTN/BNR-like repeat-containing protein [Vulcanimicrobiaceae bacterium]
MRSLPMVFAFAATALLPAQSATLAFGSLAYRGIGPAISGGRTTAVAGSNIDARIYYAGGAGGGVYKSVDGGSSWRPVFDRFNVAPIGAIAVAPKDPNNVWVGTGEGNPRNDMERGDGMWHSRDGGKTWSHVGLDDAGSISTISIDPRNPRHVVVAALGQLFRDNATRGVFVTTDDGAHWKRTLFLGPSIGASDLTRVADRPETLFAGLYHVRRQPWTMTSGGQDGGIYRSDDGGSTWRKLTGHGLPGSPTGRIGLAAGTKGRVYAIIQAKDGDLWRSDNGGATWRLMPHSSLVGARRFYFTRIYLDPANNDRLIDVGLILSMTTNGGRSFHKIATNVGWDYHHVWWSGDGRRIAIGSDEGAILSADGGEHWKQPYNLPFAQPYHVGYDDAEPNYHVCVGLQDDNSWCGPASSDSGLGVLNRDWWVVGPGDGMWAVYDPIDPHFIWSTSTASGTGQVYLWDSRTHQAYEVSPDAEINGEQPAQNLRHRFNWDTPIAFTHDGKALVGGNVVFESADRGMHWSIISPDLTRNERAHQGVPGGPVDEDMSGAETSDTILDVAPSKLDNGVIWVGTDDGLIQLTRDGGEHWTNVTPHGLPEWARVPTVEPGRFDASTAFAAVDHHMSGDDRPYLFETTDYGAHWSSISGNLPANLFVRSIRQDPKNANLLYAGTQRGVWASWDRGTHWQSLRLNMPATAIYDIQIHPRTNDLIVAAHGRGVWILDDLQPVQELANTSSSTVSLFPVRETYRWWRWAPINSFTDGTLPTNAFTGPNAPYGALITYCLPSHTSGKPTIEILDDQGRVVRHLSGKDVPHKAGLNRTSWDLQEDGPAKWTGTFEQNQGPAEGAEVLPGTYTVRLHAAGVTKEQHVLVKTDPRDTLTAAQMQQRYNTLVELNSELDGLDKILNELDKRLKHANASQARALLAFRERLTYDPRNVEDLSGPPGLRERLLDLIGRISTTSYQPPNEPQIDETARLKQSYAGVTTSWKQLSQ